MEYLYEQTRGENGKEGEREGGKE
jgi:hypothetical protein